MDNRIPFHRPASYWKITMYGLEIDLPIHNTINRHTKGFTLLLDKIKNGKYRNEPSRRWWNKSESGVWWEVSDNHHRLMDAAVFLVAPTDHVRSHGFAPSFFFSWENRETPFSVMLQTQRLAVGIQHSSSHWKRQIFFNYRQQGSHFAYLPILPIFLLRFPMDALSISQFLTPSTFVYLFFLFPL